MVNVENDAAPSTKDELLDKLRADLQRLSADLRDVTSKVDQSRSQADQLAQRNAAVVGEIKKIETALEQTPRTAIREAYSEALSSQQRLLAVRGQMEKFQAQETVLRQNVETIQSVISMLDKAASNGGGAKSSLMSSPREMIIRVIDAQEEERERLANQMHDGTAIPITNFILQAEICQKLFDKNPEKARMELGNLMSGARETFQRIRDFIFDLRPMMLTDLGLVPTLKRYQEAYQNKSGIETEMIINGRERRLESYLEVLIFRGIQELMVNARDQGGATNIKVMLEMGPDRIRAVVEDNGRGFATGQLTLDEKTSQPLGLSTLQERVHLVGGSLQIDSVSGQGARIEIEVPAGADVDAAAEGH